MNISNLDYYQQLSEHSKILGGAQAGANVAEPVIQPDTKEVLGTSLISAVSKAIGPNSLAKVTAYLDTGHNGAAYLSNSVSQSQARAGE